MLSSAGTVGARRPLRTVSQSRATPTSASRSHGKPGVVNENAERKRAREACADELAHKALSSQKEQLQRLLAVQRTELTDLHRNILDFHYTHTVCYNEDQSAEAQLLAHSSSPPISGTADASRPATTQVRSAGTAYYSNSETSCMRNALAQLLATYDGEEAEAAAALDTLQAEVKRDIVNGVLAAAQEKARGEEEAYEALQRTLQTHQSESASLLDEIHREEETIAALEKEEGECSKRKAVLEEKKKRQMDNVENTRQELAAAREAAQKAQKELRRREAVVREIQKEIDRRRDRLRKRKAAK